MSTLDVKTLQSPTNFDLILDAQGSGKDIIFKSNGSTVATLTDAGLLTATSFAGSGASLTGLTSSQMPAGSILQVLSDELTTTASSTALVSSDAWTDTGLSIAITPSATSSKIIITGMINTGAGNSGDGMCILRLMRDSTAIGIGDAASSRKRTLSGRGSEAQGSGTILTLPVHWVDSPSTTSAVTYKVQFGIRGTNPNTAYINRTGGDTDNTEHQRTASSLSVMEVAG